MRRRNKAYEEIRLQVTREALSGIKVAVLARKYGVHPETIRSWIRDHRDEIEVGEIPPADEQLQELKRLQEVEEKYQTAMKILGEKELEIEILRELVKKKNPAYPKNSR
ncbi:transposase [Paenibacillus sp. N4]|uniref:transposase n=1 Tax=Paenibacillus vietnamensis TaxID=2590547 RepID=UPI001CD04F7F|nr:transposase [Paenibacillus vietnamensis]MCA0758757.1 transposase [Paenibacillus vietnamensis]